MGGGPPASAGSSGHPCGDGETGPEAGERDVGGCEVRRGEDWAGGDVTSHPDHANRPLGSIGHVHDKNLASIFCNKSGRLGRAGCRAPDRFPGCHISWRHLHHQPPPSTRVRGDKWRRPTLVSRFLKLVSGETVSPSSPAFCWALHNLKDVNSKCLPMLGSLKT